MEFYDSVNFLTAFHENAHFLEGFSKELHKNDKGHLDKLNITFDFN